nr:hypothetical protein [Tanacetum cinerariifolium]
LTASKDLDNLIESQRSDKSKEECVVLGRDFKLLDDANILLRTPRQHNMYSIDLNNIVLHRDLTCLVAKASADECNLWHRRLGKHHKASCKSKLVTSVSKPLHTLHMDLFSLTSVSSISHKWYCLVVTDDFSGFTWTFFFKTKDETSGILRKFITEIENLKDLKVKIIRCDDGGEFRNKKLNDFCSQKGIKREFRDVRTPRQNGVAERRNRSLIEAARTMLANAKLPVTFWAEANPGYFLGYSMSSKAFRVFNKRTKRVEENLHIEFLENKAIEKGSGPNWLFDIDSLTKSMNYVSVVDAGTTSTNFSGTKVDARKDMKKDVSSLRYIVLPNWVHKEQLESTSSQPQDACNTDAPKSSGNSNPTVTSTNPPADQLETLTVETLIPTVSSPVLTVCFTDSQEPSSETRLISKRVTNQEETPSLDNILTLSNQFEDILGVTNMETTITASPTPTLRIHRDHPKSQIIEPKKIFDALQDPSWVEAMQEELIQFKIQKVWSLVDCPKGMDVKSAFLYGTIDEEVYVMQPPRFQDLVYPTRVYKVEKAMYGLHQVPRAWYGTLSKYLLTNGF